MIPDDDPIWPRAQRYIDGIPEADRKFSEKKDTASQDPRMAGNERGPQADGRRYWRTGSARGWSTKHKIRRMAAEVVSIIGRTT